MTLAEQLYQEAQTLPENMQVDVLDYIQSLKQKLLQAKSNLSPVTANSPADDSLTDVPRLFAELGATMGDDLHHFERIEFEDRQRAW